MPHPLLEEIECRLASGGPTESNLHDVLDKTLAHFGGAAGTIHTLEPESALLSLRAYRGIPESLLIRVQTIPVGKGMAGLAAERRQPVQVCNLQTEASGLAKPAAKENKMEGSIAVPMLLEDCLGGVLGIAKPMAHEFSEAETNLLLNIGAAIARCLGRA
jgi:L-methionine (R)-S-oxide reductase